MSEAALKPGDQSYSKSEMGSVVDDPSIKCSAQKKKKRNKKMTDSQKEVAGNIVSENGVDDEKQSTDETSTLAADHEKSVESNTCFKVAEVSDPSHTLKESNGLKCSKSAAKHEAVDKIRDHIQKLIGKENSQRSVRKPQIYGSRGFHHNKEINSLQNDFVMNYNRVPNKGLCYPSVSPYWANRAASHGMNNMRNKLTTTYAVHNQLCYPGKEVSHGPFDMMYCKNADVARRTYSPYYMHYPPYPLNDRPFGTYTVGGRSVRPKQFHEHTFKKDFTSRTNGKKWVPVGSKESKITVKSASIDKDNNVPSLPKEVNEMNSVEIEVPKSTVVRMTETAMDNGDVLPFSKGVNNNDSNTSLNATNPMNSAEGKDPKAKSVGSNPDNAYKSQLDVQLVTGSLADFQRLVQSAAPVILSSYVHKKCNVCVEDELSRISLCKHQRPNISLGNIWEWYKEPGCFGLGVKTGDSVSSCAYFVPYLSAIQLFDYSHLSKVFPVDAIQSPSVISPSNCKLVFEFFETEPPVWRKSLHAKIVDLVNFGTSSPRVYGDPSNLQSMKLRDIHPASWFSVAWYPIYRVPERTLFRASFLTYHSLGHLVQRHVPGNSVNETSCVVSPVLGLESYNAKVEGWFNLRIPKENHLKDSPPINCYQFVADQLSLLEKTASFFARGCVCKNGTTEFYRHPDYEFFLSRK